VLFAVPLASSWDGVTLAVKNYFQDNANNPKSIKYVECSYIMKLSNGGWAQVVKYRGENAFGGTILDEKMFLILGDGGTAKVISAADVVEFKSALAQANVKIVATYNADGSLYKSY
jgi:hypothetical protein